MKNPNTPTMIGISENMGYLFTDKGVTRMSYEKNDLNGKNFATYTHENLNIALDILKENINFKYKVGKLSLTEYTSEPRKFLNFLVETYQPQNSIKIIQEWENNFGDKLLLINESVDNLIIESRINEAWDSFKIILNEFDPIGWVTTGAKNLYNYGKEKATQLKTWTKDQAKQIKDKGFTQWAKDKASNVWNYVKDKVAAAWNCVKSGVECIMEGMRDLVYSAAGTAILTGVSFIPVIGQVTNGIIFGSLLIWDVYKGLSGKGWDIMNIIVDAIALLAPALGKMIKTAFVGIKSFAQLGAAAASKGGIFAKVFNVLKSGIGTLKNLVGKAATWLGEKLGLKSLQTWGTKVQQKLGSMVDEMTNAGGKGVKGAKGVKPSIASKQPGFKQQVKQIWAKPKPSPIPPKGVILKSMGQTFLVTTAICAALGLDGFTCKEKIESGEVTPEQIRKAEQDIQKQLLQNIESSGDEFEFEL
jgi:hypothetical protein